MSLLLKTLLVHLLFDLRHKKSRKKFSHDTERFIASQLIVIEFIKMLLNSWLYSIHSSIDFIFIYFAVTNVLVKWFCFSLFLFWHLPTFAYAEKLLRRGFVHWIKPSAIWVTWQHVYVNGKMRTRNGDKCMKIEWHFSMYIILSRHLNILLQSCARFFFWHLLWRCWKFYTFGATDVTVTKDL